MAQEIKTVTWDDKPFLGDIISLTGEVIKINRSVTTQVHTSGGGGSVSSRGNGRTNVRFDPVSTTTTNTLHDDIYLIDGDGKEHFIQVQDKPELGIREGHQIQLLSVSANVAGNPMVAPYVAIKNKTLDKVIFDYTPFKPLQFYQATAFRMSKKNFENTTTTKKVFIIIGICLTIMLAVLPPIAAILAVILIIVRFKALNNFIKHYEVLFEQNVVPALKQRLD